MHTGFHTYGGIEAHTRTHTYIQTYRHIFRQTIHTHTSTHTYIQADRHRHTCRQAHIQAHILIHTHTAGRQAGGQTLM